MSNEENYEGLRGNEFEIYLKKIGPPIFTCYLRPCAIDEIPEIFPIKHFVFCNLSPKHLRGSHWTVILRLSENDFEIFNSLGQENLDYFTPYLKFQVPFKVDFNKNSVQGIASKYCGYFSIYFIIFRILNLDMSMETVLEDIFTNDSIKNDQIVSQFCNNILTTTNDDFFSFHDF